MHCCDAKCDRAKMCGSGVRWIDIGIINIASPKPICLITSSPRPYAILDNCRDATFNAPDINLN
jgi:hypothetical protein